MMLDLEAANVFLVGLVTSAMMTKMNAKLVLMRLAFNIMLRRWHYLLKWAVVASYEIRTKISSLNDYRRTHLSLIERFFIRKQDQCMHQIEN